VAAYDAATRSGRLVRDDGTPLEFDSAALDPVVRLLRPGQRVRVRRDDGDVVVALTLAGLPLPP
jgi:2-phospho-L-lactate guanylyltransferase